MGLDGDRDDYGLPKVDVVVPDDARELERDVLAYQREVRQQRRRARWQRLGRPFTRYGIAAPFIASAVLIALISGVLMSVVSPRPTPRATTIPPTGMPKRLVGQIGGPLPAYDMLVIDNMSSPVSTLAGGGLPGAVAVVPRGCRCGPAIDGLIRQVQAKEYAMWLVADRRAGQAADDELRHLAQGHEGVRFADDPKHILADTYQANGLTAIFLHPDGAVGGITRAIQPGQNFTHDVQALAFPAAHN